MSVRPVSVSADRSTPHGSATLTPPEVIITYAELIENYAAKLGEQYERDGVSEGAAKQGKRNHLSAIKEWMSHKGLSGRDYVGPELDANFDAELESHLAYLRVKPHQRDHRIIKGLSHTTISNRKTVLCQLRDFRRSKDGHYQFPGTISEALQHLVKLHNTTPGGLAKAVGIESTNFTAWHGGKCHPSGDDQSVEAFRKIERYCGLDEGKLTSLIKPTYPRRNAKDAADEVPRSDYGQRQKRATAEKYKLHRFPAAVRAEFDELTELMTAPIRPEGGLKRNAFWFKDPESGECPTAKKYANTLAGLFGYLLLPTEGKEFPIIKIENGEKILKGHTVVKGEGCAEDDLTLALITDVPLVRRYLEFVRARAGGVYNGETVHILNFCCMLLRKETGFVRQHPDYGGRLPSPVRAEQWDGHCQFAHKRFRDILRDLTNDGLIAQSRDVEEPIEFILEDPHPIHYLYTLADLMEADLPDVAADTQRALAYRDMFLVRFLTANPLRIKHFSQMTWRADNRGNLYRKADGSWWLRFPKNAFKNRKTLNKDRLTKKYVAPLPRSLWEYVEAYLFRYRPLLLGSGECDYVFRPGPRGGASKHKTGTTKPMQEGSLSKIVHTKSGQYLRCIGFGPHAFRHIIATDYVKNLPDGIMVAASILHDKPETILKFYGHYRHSDFFKYWVDYHETQLGVARRARSMEVA